MNPVNGSAPRLHAIRSIRGMTLFEIMMATGIFTMMSAGIFATLLCARRLTESTIYENAATTIIQGYLEQLKNMNYSSLLSSPASGTSVSSSYSSNSSYIITTQKNESTSGSDYLIVSPLPVLSTTSLTPGVIPSTVYDNVKTFDVNGTSDLKMHVFLWIEDKATSTADGSQVKGITMTYMWEFKDGTRIRYSMWSIRTLRSLVPTY